MNLVFVVQVKNINVVVGPYRKTANNAITIKITALTKILFCLNLSYIFSFLGKYKKSTFSFLCIVKSDL